MSASVTVRTRLAAMAACVIGAVLSAPIAAAQVGPATVEIISSPDVVLGTVSPRFQIRLAGFPEKAEVRITLQVSRNFAILPPFLLDTIITTTEPVALVRIGRALPSGSVVYWRAIAEAGVISAISQITGPRVVPEWAMLISPASPGGDGLDERQPQFRWRSPAIDTPPGPWRYGLDVQTTQGSTVFAVDGLTDTVFRLPTPLQANTSYRWRLRATNSTGETAVFNSPGSFVIDDPPLPVTTLFYEPFPNPFPSAVTVAACFWFDIGEPGGRVTLDIVDLRGNPVRSIIPAADGQRVFPAGRYGRGQPGFGSNCDNRFVWDGTASNGRPVPRGVYLARFTAEGSPPVVRKILFNGR